MVSNCEGLLMPLSEQIYKQEKNVDLLVRYWGLGKALDDEEKEMLLKALDAENKSIPGPLHLRALERLRERGIR